MRGPGKFWRTGPRRSSASSRGHWSPVPPRPIQAGVWHAPQLHLDVRPQSARNRPPGPTSWLRSRWAWNSSGWALGLLSVALLAALVTLAPADTPGRLANVAGALGRLAARPPHRGTGPRCVAASPGRRGLGHRLPARPLTRPLGTQGTPVASSDGPGRRVGRATDPPDASGRGRSLRPGGLRRPFDRHVAIQRPGQVERLLGGRRLGRRVGA